MSGKPGDGFVSAMLRVSGSVTLIRFALVAVFLWVGPLWTICSGLGGGTLLLALLGLLMSAVSLRAFLETWCSTKRARLCTRLSVVLHLVYLGAGLTQIFWPPDAAWSRLLDSGEDLAVTFAPGRGLLVVDGHGMRTFDGEDWSEAERPGGFTYLLGVDGDDVWIAPRDGSVLHVQQDGEWRPQGRPPGTVRGGAREGGRQVVVARGLLSDTATRTDHVSGVTDVALTRGRALAVGDRWWLSRGGPYEEVTPPNAEDGSWDVSGGDGVFYAYSSRSGEGRLLVGNGDSFDERSPPNDDVRALVVNPHNGEEAVAGTWGEDIHYTQDGGRSWSVLGLRGIQARTLAVDWAERQLYVASSNMLFDKGIWTRRLPE